MTSNSIGPMVLGLVAGRNTPLRQSSTPAATSSAAIAVPRPSAGRIERRPPRPGSAIRARADGPAPKIAPSACSSSPTVLKRASGAAAVARSTTRTSASGRSGRASSRRTR